MVIDMHIHTRFSPCSIIHIPQLLTRARERGLDGICITDHDTIASKDEVERTADHAGICVIVGIEYTTSKGDFLVYGPVNELPSRLDAESLLQWVNKEGGVCIPAHPFRRSRPVDTSILKSFQIIESLNGRNRRSENELCRNWLFEHGNGNREIGGSDAHTLGEIGQIVTVFQNNIYNADDLIRELKSKDYSPVQRSLH